MSRPTHIQDAVFVILGATGGMGSALAKQLSQQGAKLVLGARDQEKLSALAKEIQAESCHVDISNPKEIDACIAHATAHFGRIDGVANCVGSLLLKPAHLTTDAEWDATLQTNLTSAFFTVRAATKSMMETGGAIVLVSSAAAQVGLSNHEAIAASKAGIIGLVRSAAATYAPRNIRINCVAPGMVASPLTARITNNERALKHSTTMHALGRIGQADEVARAMAWLLDPKQSWTTGQVFGIDGGLAHVRPTIKA